MHHILVIGCGQLGSRHLQALTNYPEKIRLSVVDPSEVSLTTARSRIESAAKTLNTHDIDFVTDVSLLKDKNVSLAVIATNSLQRLAVFQALVKHCDVQNIIFEKVLFPNRAEYAQAQELLSSKRIAAWVNCPRRCYSIYQELHQEHQGPGKIPDGWILDYKGYNWGLACNSVHFLDLVAFLADSQLVRLDTSELIPQEFPSKRPGYVEYYGLLKGHFTDGSITNLYCAQDEAVKTEMRLATPAKTLTIEEGAGRLLAGDKVVKNFKLPYQSELTHLVAQDILQKGTCALPQYADSMNTHLVFIDGLLKFRNSFMKETAESLAIT